MGTLTLASPNAYNATKVTEALDDIADALQRVMAGVLTLKSLLVPEAERDAVEFDPKDAANKYGVGGFMKLTPKGINICYRLFDAGKSRNAVATLMDISFGAATYRFEAWKKLGGVNRIKDALE